MVIDVASVGTWERFGQEPVTTSTQTMSIPNAGACLPTLHSACA